MPGEKQRLPGWPGHWSRAAAMMRHLPVFHEACLYVLHDPQSSGVQRDESAAGFPDSALLCVFLQLPSEPKSELDRARPTGRPHIEVGITAQ